MSQDHWLPGFNFNVEEWMQRGRLTRPSNLPQLALARAAFEFAIEEARGRFMIGNCTRVVKRHPGPRGVP